MDKPLNYPIGGARNPLRPSLAYSSHITNTFRSSSLIPWFSTLPLPQPWFILFFSCSLIL
jgi:hypothetical protein